MKEDLVDIAYTLDRVEELILDGRTNYYNSEQVGVLYSSLRQLKDCFEWVNDGNNYVEATQSKRLSHIKDLRELVLKIERITKTRVSSPIFTAINEEVGSLHDVIMENARSAHVESKTEKENKILRQELMEQKKIAQRVNDLASRIDERAKQVELAANKLYDVGERKTSKEWTDEYFKYVAYETSYKPLSKSTKKATFFPLGIVNFWISSRNLCGRTYSSLFRDRLLYKGLSYNNLVKKWQFWRTVWLMLLFGVAVIYLIAFWSYDFTHRGLTSYILDKTKFLPLLVIVTVGFSFASRNYKINAHLLEQYKHRYVVAKTMSNLMTLDNLKDELITRELMQLGSKVLFEFRNSGYMSKHDGEGVPTQEILSFISKMNNKA